MLTMSLALPEPLSGKFKDSFAFTTLSVRVPVIITKMIDYLCRQRKVLPVQLQLKGEDQIAAENETKDLIEKLAKLKYELTTNKPFVELNSNLEDTKLWNDCLRTELERTKDVTWFNVSWLYAECYVYRRIREIFYCSKYYQRFDPFDHNKKESFQNSKDEVIRLTAQLELTEKNLESQSLKDLFHAFLMASLYGNKCDLSMSCGDANNKGNLEFKSLDSKIVSNHFPVLWTYVEKLLKQNKETLRLDIILDNAGYELFTDLVFVEFLHRSKIFPKDKTKVYLHTKVIPWFVSDTLNKDFKWLLYEITENPDFKPVSNIGKDFIENIQKGVWNLKEDYFWTSPYDYSLMFTHAPDLYKHLSSSDLIIFKGDLNYRKLVGDLKWNFQTTFKDSLRQFQPPTALASLRTIKADVVVGIDDQNILEQINSKYPSNWMETGDYAVVQFVNNH